jgi:hypothetical protein
VFQRLEETTARRRQVAIPSIPARKALDLQKIQFLLDLISADDPGNVHAGKLAVLPPGAPTTQAD